MVGGYDRTAPVTCGEATMGLLARYGVDTVFGIPGVHTLDFYRGLATGPITHVQARNEQGAGFMADGYARVSGRPGVALVISGPGVTNALTAIGQARADSVPVLLLSSETASHTLGKGWGMLHEIPDQIAVTEPLTAFSARVTHPDELPGLVARAFAVFASERPRPVHISIPLDVAAMPVTGAWQPKSPPDRPRPDPDAIASAARLLADATKPMILLGGGAVGAAPHMTPIAEMLRAPVVASTAGKGIVADHHPLSLSASTVRPEVQEYLGRADAILAIGTEIAETDSFVDRLDLTSNLVRIDLDPRKIDDLYPAAVGIVADAGQAAAALSAELADHASTIDRIPVEAELATIRDDIAANLTDSEHRHRVFLQALRGATPEDTVFMGDICQVVYTGAFEMPVARPRLWHYPAGYCTLGCGVPNAIGAKLAMPDSPVVCLTGDGGIMFTVQELVVGAELGLPIPVIVWDNGGLKQIQDDMEARNIDLVGVTGRNPDWPELAAAFGCAGAAVASANDLEQAVERALGGDRPTLITVREADPWLDG